MPSGVYPFSLGGMERGAADLSPWWGQCPISTEHSRAVCFCDETLWQAGGTEVLGIIPARGALRDSRNDLTMPYEVHFGTTEEKLSFSAWFDGIKSRYPEIRERDAVVKEELEKRGLLSHAIHMSLMPILPPHGSAGV